jgi:hypothetical protein
MPSVGSNSQHIDTPVLGRRPPSPRTFPATPRRRSRKQSAPPVKLLSTPRPAASRPVLAVAQGSPEPRWMFDSSAQTSPEKYTRTLTR